MGFSQTSIDRVREAVDFVEVVSQYTDLKRAGQRFSGLCPFHDERTPSFSVDPVGKYYKCFGCDVGGDVFRFVEEKEGLTFPEALEALAERYGVEIERESEDPRAEEARRHRARIQELLGRTAEFYERFLWDSPKAAKAREYLLGRGLSEEALREFGVGMAPQAWDQVLVGSQRAGYKVVELESAGLVQKGRQGGHYDRFRTRITFPIRDARGRVIGFGARALSPDSKPKYLNSPEGVFKKSESLYGIDKARPAIAKSRRAIVVEGYTDVIALHQAGIEDVVAIMGTAITPDQLKKLAGLGVERVQLALDADSAGANAMIRAQRVAAERALELEFAAMPEGEDPADMLEGGQADRFRQIIEDSIDYGTFRVRTTLDRADLGSPTGRDRALKEIAPVMQAMGETVTRDELMKEVVDRLDTDVHRVTEAVRTAKAEDLEPPAGATGSGGARREGDGGAAAPRAPLTPREARERALLAMCIADPAAGREYLARLDPGHLSASGRPAFEWLRGHLDDPVSDLPRDDEELVSLITELAMRAERDPHSAGSMEMNFMLLEQQRLEDGISAAREAGDMEEVQRLSREGSNLTTKISQTESFGP